MIKVFGKQQVLNKISGASNKMDTSVPASLKLVGQKGVNYAKMQSPVKTGRLRNSMSYTCDGYVSGFGADSVQRSNDPKAVYIGTNVIYAPSVEYTSRNGSAGFMLRAYNQTVSDAEGIMKTKIRGSFN